LLLYRSSLNIGSGLPSLKLRQGTSGRLKVSRSSRRRLAEADDGNIKTAGF